jgi:hypothetical protein
MTMPFDVFAQAEPEADPQSAAAEWSQALQDPRVKASMLSMGLQLLQPVQPGQTVAGHIGRAIGAGGETVGNIEELNRKESEQARKERDTNSTIDWRADRTENERTRLEVAQQNANSLQMAREAAAQVAGSRVLKVKAEVEKLQMQVQLMPGDQQLRELLNQKKMELISAQTDLAAGRAAGIPAVNESIIRRNNATADVLTGGNLSSDRRTYEAAKAKHESNQRFDDPAKKTPFISFEQWRQQTGGQPAVSSQPEAPPDLGTFEPAPMNPKQRRHGVWYSFPNGRRAMWDAQQGGWVAPESLGGMGP